MRFRLDREEILDYFSLNVGTVGDIPFNLPIDRLGKHLLISGQTGTGKSRFAMQLAAKAENYMQKEKVNLLVIDIEGEWSGIIPYLDKKTEYFDVEKKPQNQSV